MHDLIAEHILFLLLVSVRATVSYCVVVHTVIGEHTALVDAVGAVDIH